MTDNVIPLVRAASAQEIAASWLIVLEQRPLTDRENEELRAWLLESKVHRQIFKETAAVYDQAQVLKVLADLQPIDDDPSNRPAATFDIARTSKSNFGLAVVAVLALVATMMAVFDAGEFFGMGSPETRYATDVGGREALILEDDTRVTLNTDSALRVRYGPDSRRVVLERGEAFFSVSPDPRRPFVVDAGSGLVTAIGTKFSVYKRDDSLQVTVMHGQVRVQTLGNPEEAKTDDKSRETIRKTAPGQSDSSTLLEPGQVSFFDGSVERVEMLAPEVLSRKLLWQQGMLAFEGDALSKVIEEFSRYTEMEVVLENPELGNIRVDGYFRLDDISGMLNSLQTNFGIDVVPTDSKRIVLRRPLPEGEASVFSKQ